MRAIMTTAAEARAISDAAIRHERERAEMQERHFREMAELTRDADLVRQEIESLK